MRALAALPAALLTVLLAVLTGAGCGIVEEQPEHRALTSVVPYDVRLLLDPPGKYLGITYPNADDQSADAEVFALKTGREPNMIGYFVAFGDQPRPARLAEIWSGGALPMISWEPHGVPLTQIAEGRYDRYIVNWAASLRDARVPVALSFGHEMNGGWFSWGSKDNTPAEFVAAYRHIHDLFQRFGASNVIWVWSPNVVSRPGMALAPYWAGPAYVDWVGPIGYYEWSHGAESFDELFGPTLEQIRELTDRPVLLPETAAPEGPGKAEHILDLLENVVSDDDIVGLLWFDFDKERDWRYDSSPAALRAFRQGVSPSVYGFDPRDFGRP